MESKKLKVAVLSGGPSGEREVSLRSGESVAKNLSKEKYHVSIIDVVDETHWLIVLENGETTEVDPTKEDGKKILKGFDLFFNALHGPYGEDGQVQKVLETIGKPYTGSGVKTSEEAMDKVASMKLVAKGGIMVPDFFEVGPQTSAEEVPKKIKEKFGYPTIIKPNATGSTLGLSLIAKEEEIAEALKKALAYSDRVIIQRYIFGREFTCGVLGNAGEGLTVLFPIEIIIKNKIFDFNDKYFSKETQEICPAQVDKLQRERIEALVLKAHELLGCDGLSRTDMRMDGMNQLYFLETNTSPGLTETSLCPKEAAAQNIPMHAFLDQIIFLALSKKN